MLACEDLPEPHVGLERAKCIGAQSLVMDSFEIIHDVDEFYESFVGQVGKLGEDEIPTVQIGEFVSQVSHGLRADLPVRGPSPIQLT